MTPVQLPEVPEPDACPHFWSMTDSAGFITCAWCCKRVRSPIQYTTSTTTPPEPNSDRS